MDWALRDEYVQATVFGPARAVLIVLADHANQAGEAWPSLGTLAAESGFGDGTVSRALRDLVALGVLENRGYRHRARVRGLNLTSARAAEVATGLPPDFRQTSARVADKPEPEPIVVADTRTRETDPAPDPVLVALATALLNACVNHDLPVDVLAERDGVAERLAAVEGADELAVEDVVAVVRENAAAAERGWRMFAGTPKAVENTIRKAHARRRKRAPRSRSGAPSAANLAAAHAELLAEEAGR